MGSHHCGEPKPDPPIKTAKIRRSFGLENVQLRGRTLTFWGGGTQYHRNYTTEKEAEEEFERLKKENKK
jgi:hypothetical protein